MTALGVALFGGRALVTVGALGYVLEPDTLLYATGHAYWSSPLAALLGDLDGYRGEQLLGVLGAAALGAILAREARGALAFLPVAALYLLPLGYAAWCASPDAAGAACAAASYRLRGRAAIAAVAVTGLVHLEAALVLAAVLIVQRPFWRVPPAIAGLAAGAVACLGEWHLQARYFLPGASIAAVEIVRRASRPAAEAVSA